MAKTYSYVCRPPDEPIQENISQLHQGREWLDLKALTRYASISERTMRQWIHRASNPLPAVRVGAKILVRRSEFDCWLENHRLEPMDVGCIVNEMVADLIDTN
jgi:excisionase family DNA binding protein